MGQQNTIGSHSTQTYSDELEKVVLGSLIIEKDAFDRVEKELHSGLFYKDKNAVIAETLLEMRKKDEPIDMATLITYMQGNGSLNRIQGDMMYIVGLTDMVASTIHLERHILYLKDLFVKREVVRIAQEAIRDISENKDVGDILKIYQSSLSKLEEGAYSHDGPIHISRLIDQSLKSANVRVENKRNGITPGITTGLHDLDKVTNGWQDGKLIIVAARPAMGKTAFSLKFAKSASMVHKSVAIFSLEMDGESLADRLILSESEVESRRYASGSMSDSEVLSLNDTSSTIFNLPIYVDDNTNTTIRKIESKARLLQKREGCDIIIIDYLQLTESDERTGSREQEIASISRAAKKMARKLKVPVILLSQLSRAVESRANKRPMLSDLRESGAIEQDADIVCFLYRADYYKDPSGAPEILYGPDGNSVENGVEFIIAKNRNGSTGSIIVQHDGTLNKIFDYETNKMPF